MLIVFFCGLYLLPLGLRPIMRPDEFRYAEIAREMLVTGNWISPRLNGVRYFEKPAPGMALNAVSFRIFGENAFALRFGSALAVLLTAAVVFGFARRNSRDPLMPGIATAVYLTSALVYGVGTFAVLDSWLTLFLTLTVTSVYDAWQGPPNARKGWRYWAFAAVFALLPAGIFAGFAFLVKGFLALAVPGMVAAAFLIWQKAWKKLLLFPWLPAVAMAMVVLPWAFAIHILEPDFWRYFIMEEHVNRFLSSTYDRDPQSPFYFVPILLGGCLPAGLVWFAAWRGVKRDAFRRPFIRFLLCWAVLPFLFFSASSCKLGTYILPCFPPLALLTAAALCRALRACPAKTRRALTILRRCWGVLWLIIAAAVPVFLLVAPHVKKLPAPYPDGAGFAWAFFAAALVYGTLNLRSGRLAPGKQLAALTFGIIAPVIAGLAALPVPLFGDRMTGVGLAECRRQVPVSPDDVVVTGRSEMAAVAWTLKRADLIVIGKPGELAYGFENYPGEYAGRHYPNEALPELIARHRGKLVYITTKRNLRKHPPPPGGVHAEHCGMVIWRY